MPTGLHPDLLAHALTAIVGADQVLVDVDLTAGYATDWTRRFAGSARLVVRPGSTDEVAGVLRACSAAGATVVTQGGNTGMVGGGVPLHGEVVLSTRRLTTLGSLDPLLWQVTVGAGATLAAVQAHARAAGLELPIDLAARDSATIGGMVATNAGGIHAVRHGPMRSHVTGVEAVLADGRRIGSLAPVSKDATGYHWPSLLVGSEGTLAVVTAVRLRLVAPPRHRATALLGLPDVASAVAAAVHLRTRLPSVEALELWCADAADLVARHAGAVAPFATPAYLLVECADARDPIDDLAEALADLPHEPATALATDSTDRARLWEFRESISESIGREPGIVHKLDVGVPLACLADFVEVVPDLARAACPGARVILFGHVGDGNLHVNVLGVGLDDESADDAILEAVVAREGSISAEHGIGTAKVRWLPRVRSADDIAAMRALKAALDPAGILNPYAIFPF